jgi:hypothetical protein
MNPTNNLQAPRSLITQFAGQITRKNALFLVTMVTSENELFVDMHR